MNTTLTERNWNIAMQVLKPASELKTLPITALHPFKDHPYKVQDNEEMDALVESIRENGISGTTFDRPDFQRMEAMIEAGQVSTVIVKDSPASEETIWKPDSTLRSSTRHWVCAS